MPRPAGEVARNFWDLFDWPIAVAQRQSIHSHLLSGDVSMQRIETVRPLARQLETNLLVTMPLLPSHGLRIPGVLQEE